MVDSNAEMTITPWDDAGKGTKVPTPKDVITERSQVAPLLSKSKSKEPKYPPMAPSEAASSIRESDKRHLSSSKQKQ